MDQNKLKILLQLTAVLTVTTSVTVTGDYIRPPPRKTLHFPWDPKPSSQPQQV